MPAWEVLRPLTMRLQSLPSQPTGVAFSGIAIAGMQPTGFATAMQPSPCPADHSHDAAHRLALALEHLQALGGVAAAGK